MENLEKLKKLVNKAASKWTAKDREFIVGLSAEHGLRLNTLCKNCYIDAAVELYYKLSPEGPSEDAGGYSLLGGVDVVLHHAGATWRVCAATLTKETAEIWLKHGLPKKYFATLPQNESNVQNAVE